MFSLPPATARHQQLPKKAVYARYELKAGQKAGLDADISRMDIVALISPETVPALAPGNDIKDFYVLAVQLKRRAFDPKSISLLARLIPQRIVFALQYAGCTQFAVFHSRLFLSAWSTDAQAVLPLAGLNLDAAWENLVKVIGQVEVADGRSLTEQIETDEKQARVLSKIVALQKKLAGNKQPRRKRLYFEEIKKLKEQLNGQTKNAEP